MAIPASIFGNYERTDPSPSRHSESTFAFLCRVAGPVWDQCRELIDTWLAAYPVPDRNKLVARLNTVDDREFISAFWELYLHETYRRDGWAIEIEPEVPGARTCPDFLVRKNEISYYVEARCIFGGSDNRGGAARLRTVYDAIDGINSGAFHLAVTAVRIGSRPPRTRGLRIMLETWLAQLDPDEDVSMLSDESIEYHREWKDDDWHLVFRAIPRTIEARKAPAQRPLGVFLPANASFVDDVGSLRDALKDKGSKYGSLPHPLVVAMNTCNGFHSDRDTAQALYGTVGWQFDSEDPGAESADVLTAPGYWGWPGFSAHTHVAGLLLAEGFHYGRVARDAPAFWAHPKADQTVDPLPTWRVASVSSDGVQHTEGLVPLHEYFALPMGWPIGEPFPPRMHNDVASQGEAPGP